MTHTTKKEMNLILSEYLKEELLVTGHFWRLNLKDQNLDELILDKNRRNYVIYCLGVLSKSIRKVLNLQIKEMCLRLTSELHELINYESFKLIADQLLKNQIKWNHIIILLVFAVELIVAEINENPSRQFIDSIYFYLCTYFNNYLLNWINDNQAFEGLISYANTLDEDSFLDGWSMNFIIKFATISIVSLLLIACILIVKNKIK